jgi:magnesium transporter
MIVDSAIYVDGRRDAASSLDEIHQAWREKSGFAWIGLYNPTREEFDSSPCTLASRDAAGSDA